MTARDIPAWAAHPSALERADRVRLLAECARALLDGKMPGEAARMFTAGGLLAWLEHGDGDLLREYWRVRAPNGSRETPQKIIRTFQGVTPENDRGMLPSFPDEEQVK